MSQPEPVRRQSSTPESRTPETLNKTAEIYESITPEDLRDVARKYFTENNRTVITLTGASK